MANTVTSQTLLDGDRKLVILLTGLLDTSNEARTLKVDVSTFSPPATKVRVDRIEYSIAGSLQVILDWDASTPVRFAVLSGQGEVEACSYGGLQNNAGAGITGDIHLTTAGYSAGTVGYMLTLEMTKVSF